MKRKFLIFILAFFILSFFILRTNNPVKDRLNNCQNLKSSSEKLQCWEDLIDSKINSKDIEGAFEIVEQLYKDDPVFVSNCHDFVHLIGQKTYQLFSENQKFNLPNKTAYCGYGFYHAFMEALVNDGADLNKARQFCDWVDQKMHSKNADVKGACYHGIGHGTADNHDTKKWKDEADLVDNALDLCEQVALDQVLLNRCSSGVFNVLAIAYFSNRLKMDSKDPLWFCRKFQNDIYQKTCYEEMNTALFVLSNKDFLRAAKFIAEIKKDEFATSAMRSLASVFGVSAVQSEDFEKIISGCRQLQARLRLSCLRGFAAGFMEGGSPGTEYEKALKYCQINILTEQEKAACFEELLWLSSINYPKEKHQTICNLVDNEFRKYCQ